MTYPLHFLVNLQKKLCPLLEVYLERRKIITGKQIVAFQSRKRIIRFD
jgi:hypothetical protein